MTYYPTTPRLLVKFWGVRGTLPAPGTTTLRYGGHTPCVEVFAPSTGTRIIFDAGTGLVRCGEEAMAKGRKDFHILISHFHYDHIIGLTGFTPFFRDDCKIYLYGHRKGKELFENALKGVFRAPYFPISFDALPAKENIKFQELPETGGTFVIDGLQIQSFPLNHPQLAHAYRVTHENKSLVYATDHEHGTDVDNQLIDFISETDLFIYDSTYSADFYRVYEGWGHSTSSAGAHFALKGNVDSYAIFHHDHFSTDDFLETVILPEALSIFPRSFLAKEGEMITLASSSENI